MKKQRFSMYVIVLLVAALLAGCTALPADGQRPSSAAPEAAPGQVTLTLIDNPEGQSESMLQLQEKCQQQTGVDLKVEVAPHGEVRTKLEAALAAQASTYDLFAIDVIDLAKYAAAGWALPLDAYITPEMEADILPFAPGRELSGSSVRPALEGGVDVLCLQRRCCRRRGTTMRRPRGMS